MSTNPYTHVHTQAYTHAHTHAYTHVYTNVYTDPRHASDGDCGQHGEDRELELGIPLVQKCVQSRV